MYVLYVKYVLYVLYVMYLVYVMYVCNYPSISYIFYFFVFFVLRVYACVPLSSISGSRQSQLELLPFGDSLREWAHRQLRCLKSVGVVCLYSTFG